MILRRIAQHLRDQNWTAIGIEFVLLVLGVFLGIQVANWNSERHDEHLAQRYLSDIAADVRSDLTELARVQDSAMDRASASSYLLQQIGLEAATSRINVFDAEIEDLFSDAAGMQLPEPGPPEERERNRLWELSFMTYGFDMNRAAYDALIGSGKLDLIRNPELMRLLREYYYLVNALDQSQQRTSFPIRNATLEIGMVHGLSPGLMLDEAVLIGKIRDTPALAASVATSRQLAGLTFLISKVQRAKGEQLLQAIESEVSR